jgi:hypothetical protein
VGGDAVRTLARIAIGAGIGCAVATAFLICMITFVETVLYPRGVRYDDLTLAYFSWGLLMAAPIVGAWWAWVRS